VLKKYPKDVKVVFKAFPLRSHAFAKKATKAALAAGRQGKFWEMHDKIFAQYNRLSDDKLQGFAKELGLDMDKFAKDMESAEIDRRIQQDLQMGVQAGVRGTPTIFINGRRLKNRSLEGFSAKIDAVLEEMKK